MKKLVSLILLTALSIAALTSCSTVSYKDIKSLSIQDVTCQTFFLYYFCDANIYDYAGGYEGAPTSEGFVYSSEELHAGDEITVWSDVQFGYDVTRYGTTATVNEVSEIFPIELIRSGNAYNISFYSLVDEALGAGSTVSYREELAEAKKYKVEIITDESVLIEFFA